MVSLFVWTLLVVISIKECRVSICNLFCFRVGNYAVILGKNRSPKPPSSPQVVGNGNSREANAHREARWNVIPQLRRGLNRGYGAIRRPNNPQVCKVIDKCILLLKLSGDLNPELVLY